MGLSSGAKCRLDMFIRQWVQKARNVFGRILSIRINCDGDVRAGFQREIETCAQCYAFAAIVRQRQNFCAIAPGHRPCLVATAIVYDNYPVDEDRSALDNVADRLLGIEGRNDTDCSH